jgi:hypothetical protein
MSERDVAAVESAFIRQLAQTETAWTVTYYFLTARSGKSVRSPLV